MTYEQMVAIIRTDDAEKLDELRAYMTNARELLEFKAVPDEPFEIDIIEEFDKVIEEAIGRRIVPAPLPPADEQTPAPVSTDDGG